LNFLLHITNGTAVVDKMRQAGIAGRIVPWNDFLHEGPVPAGLNASALRDVRAQFIAGEEGSYDEIVRSLAERDAALEDLRGVDEIVLWFEHDLYDQLQLVQVLDRLPIEYAPRVSAVPGDDYLSLQTSSQFAGLFPARQEVTSAQRVAARDAWQAFRNADPRAILDVLPRVTVLPHLASALMRHLQQFPSLENGLSRTEQQAFEAMARGVTRLRDVYVAANHEREEAVFMADLVFVSHVRTLSPRLITWTDAAKVPLNFDSELTLTTEGRRVLEGTADRVSLCGIDRWLGGVHLTGHGPLWRWDDSRQTLRIA
jgi:hypothetical protein